jgi:tetratricopeptide (TPR) repeat protein
MRISSGFAATLWLCAMTAGPALADGGGSGDGGDRTNTTGCGSGQVWDSKTGKCVKAEKGVLPDKALAANAFALAKAERYAEALAVLDLLQDPNTAVALNYRGYATRKLDRVDEGIGYYLKSLALDPQYAQVREYLGEAFVQKGDIASAKEQLQAIEKICGTGCEEYEDLAEAIANSSPS